MPPSNRRQHGRVRKGVRPLYVPSSRERTIGEILALLTGAGDEATA
jgi:hypothetical protein